MEIIFLGTGTGAPSAKRGAPGLTVRAGNVTLLFDSGSGTLRQLARAGLSYNDLDYLFYTHLHPDHTTDLISYLFATRYFPEFTRTKPARIYGPMGLLDFYGHLHEGFGHWIEPPEGRVVLSELPPGHTISCGSAIIETAPIIHTPESLGYRVSESGGATLAVTGDTDFNQNLIDLARGADLLITECSLPEGLKVEGHLIPSLAGRAAREAGVKALALTHFYPQCEGQDLLKPITKEFSGPVTLAEDLQRLTL
ncbi:MAG: MBL fold metallo-hydrolase [Deltaproteobacteria bacterium]|nr:MBL fold metallo-hydrolase [Deltaproteobacteria bacterium]MBW2051327.1 MBL fold metallo-hydrolase [Deltaproteobacteria bacterium]MBW2141294.1 MBL fold metallo-hydrolase [Deltaproteobacteria bacterium]MBW2322803.1 MBL fold metallo-hydrolase [Deltaproteobacteria bacterium]